MFFFFTVKGRVLKNLLSPLKDFICTVNPGKMFQNKESEMIESYHYSSDKNFHRNHRRKHTLEIYECANKIYGGLVNFAPGRQEKKKKNFSKSIVYTLCHTLKVVCLTKL